MFIHAFPIPTGPLWCTSFWACCNRMRFGDCFHCASSNTNTTLLYLAVISLMRSPTIGAYDKLAIRYGYTHSASTDAEAAVIRKDFASNPNNILNPSKNVTLLQSLPFHSTRGYRDVVSTQHSVLHRSPFCRASGNFARGRELAELLRRGK